MKRQMQRSEDDETMSVEKLKSNVMARIKAEKRWGMKYKI